MPVGVLLSVSKGIIEHIPLVLCHSSNSKETTLSGESDDKCM